jgi:hypothetical protein
MDSADEQMVLDEIKGRAMDALVYEIEQGGKTVTGLSLAGVRETARVMNVNGKARIGISDREPIILETEEYFEAKAFAQDTMNGGGYWGVKRQPKQYKTRAGSLATDPFAFEKALAKAQRNALRGLIPEWFVKEMIDAWRAKGKVKKINAPASRPATEEPTTDLSPSEPVTGGASEQPETRMCKIHGAPMTKRYSEKKDKHYFAHAGDDGKLCFGSVKSTAPVGK